MSNYDGLAHTLWYTGCKGLCQIVTIGAFGIRGFGRENVPAKGGALLASNHQSFLDPVAVGSCLPRQVHYMARESLFRQSIFGRLLRSVNSFPVIIPSMKIAKEINPIIIPIIFEKRANFL